MKRLGFFCILLFVAACGGRQSMASKSAAAYDEAKKKGIEVSGGHEHEGHGHAPQTTTSPTHDHAMMHEHGTTTTGGDHKGMHHEMPAHETAVDHSKMHHGAQAGRDDHAAMQQHADHTAPTADHSQMHNHAPTTAAIPTGGLWGPVAAPAPQARPLGTAPAPVTSREMQELQPSQTLKKDNE